MLISRQALTITNIIATSAVKGHASPSCHNVNARPDGTIEATDGHILVRVKRNTQEDPAEFPTVQGMPIPQPTTEPALIPVDVVKRLIGAMPKRATLPILQTAYLAKSGGNVQIAATDLQAPTVAVLDTDGTFPQTDRVMDSVSAQKSPTINVTLRADVLMMLAKIAKQAKGNDRGKLTLTIPTDKPVCEAAMSFECKGDSDHTIVGAVMPCRP